jgi:hypothetical protein
MAMDYKVVPFTAKITHSDTVTNVAQQLERLIREHTAEGWEYVRLENVETMVAADSGCFGFGGKPAFTTVFKMAVFKK